MSPFSNAINRILTVPRPADLTAAHPDPTFILEGERKRQFESLDAPYARTAIVPDMLNSATAFADLAFLIPKQVAHATPRTRLKRGRG